MPKKMGKKRVELFLVLLPISKLSQKFRYDVEILNIGVCTRLNIHSSYLNLLDNLEAYNVLYLPENSLV